MQKDFFVLQVGESIEKSRYAEYVLRKLPAWFADEEALREYIQGVKDSLLWAAFDRNDSCIGFFSIKTHYQCIGEIYVCGVLPELRGRGIGRAIYNEVENYLIQRGYTYMVVKTLSDTIDYEPYAQTREFYRKLEFQPLITLKEMWSIESPCLIMLKRL